MVRIFAPDFATVFKINEFIYLDYVTPCFIFFIALAQQILAFVIIREELPKFGYQLNEPKNLPLSLSIGLITSLVLVVIFAFVYGPLAYLFSLVGIFLGIYALIYLILENKKILYIILVAALMVSVFLFAVFYPLVPAPYGLLFVNIFFFIVAIIVLFNNYLLKGNKKDTIS